MALHRSDSVACNYYIPKNKKEKRDGGASPDLIERSERSERSDHMDAPRNAATNRANVTMIVNKSSSFIPVL